MVQCFETFRNFSCHERCFDKAVSFRSLCY